MRYVKMKQKTPMFLIGVLIACTWLALCEGMDYVIDRKWKGR